MKNPKPECPTCKKEYQPWKAPQGYKAFEGYCPDCADASLREWCKHN